MAKDLAVDDVLQQAQFILSVCANFNNEYYYNYVSEQ